MFTNGKAVAALVCALLAASAAAADNRGQSRGELLYSTHCIGCHTSEIHWRDRKAATDLRSLRFQVTRWQGNAGLGWSDSDIDAVTRYLNRSIYRYAPTPRVAASLPR